MMDDLERELDADVGPGTSIFRGTGSPGKPSNLHTFYEAPKRTINDLLKEQDEVELLVTEAQVLLERSKQKEKEAMMKGLK